MRGTKSKDDGVLGSKSNAQRKTRTRAGASSPWMLSSRRTRLTRIIAGLVGPGEEPPPSPHPSRPIVSQDREGSRNRSPWRDRSVIPLLMVIGLVAGCIELQAIGSGPAPPPMDDGGSPPDDNPRPGGDGGDGQLAVRLSASNPTPQPNEVLVLTCSLTSGEPEGVTFRFEPSNDRLIVGPQAGVASLIITESDVGVSMSFTCSARDEQTQSDSSDPVLIVPFAPPIP